MRIRILATFAVALAVSSSTSGFAADAAPPAFIQPYPGSTAYTETVVKDFDEVDFVIAKVVKEPPSPAFKRVEGKVTTLVYNNPEGRSTLEIFKNYEQALLKAGFQKVFSCTENKECGETVLVPTWKGAVSMFQTYNNGRYLTAKLARPEGTAWVSIHTQQSPVNLTTIRIAEEKAMEKDLVAVDAAALKGALERDGHIAVYGIQFDSGKATLKPESAAAFEEIKKLMDATPALIVYVVGHTDDVGEASANVDLSNRRAEAAVKELTTKHKIAASRLRARGVGPYVPVASNRNEAGRTKNRRVELVEATH